MTTACPIRFDPATGRLEGTDLPPAADLIRQAREAGMTPFRSRTWNPSTRCGCAVGMAAALRDPDGFGQRDINTLGDAQMILAGDNPPNILWGVAAGFDLSVSQAEAVAREAGGEYAEGIKYGQAVAKAAWPG